MANLNPEVAFRSLKDRVKVAISQQFPFEGRKHRLELVDLKIQDDSGTTDSPYHIDNIEAQYSAKTKGQTWAVPIRATLRLIDVASGKVIDEDTVTLARLPKITRRYSYIIKGNERQHDSVFRLKSRPYHLISDNGDIRAAWNVAKGYGFDLKIDNPDNYIKFKLGTSHIPMYRMLETLGVSDDKMRNAWGDKIFEVNKKKSKPNDILKAYKSLAKPGKNDPIPSISEAEDYVRETFENTRLRPDAMEAAFGKPYDRVNGENLLLSSKRIIDISKGTGEEDDRQALSAKDLAGTEDFIVDAIEKRSWEIKRRVQNNLQRKTKIRDILSGVPYTKVIEGTFDKSQIADQTNPLGFVSGYMRTTLIGPEYGGVKGEHTALDRDKLINPTHIGFLDPIQTPESEVTGVTLNLPLGVKKEGLELKTQVYDVRAKKWVEATPGKLEWAVVAYPDQVKWENGKPKPVASEVAVYDKDRSTATRPWREVDYVLPSAKGLFGFSTNLIPFLQNDNGNRAMMGAKQQEQALSLKYREAPLVQTKSENPRFSFERVLGSFNSHVSPVDGTVAKVEKGLIIVKGSSGKLSRVQIYDNYPLNGGQNMMTAEPVVKVGDKVKKGQLLADTNYTRGGELALGSNIRVAYTPFHGLNFEDGIVVSESAAKKFSSEHMHVETAQLYSGSIVNKDQWSDYSVPERATPERLGKLDPDGIIKNGEKVENGDVLIALLMPNAALTREDKELKSIHRSLVRDYKDRAVIWDHDAPGTVVKIIRDRKKIEVHVRTTEPMVVGDKLSGRHGNKGIVSRILPDHKMPHDKSGEPVHVLLNPASVPSRMNVGQVLETVAGKIAKKTGKPYVIENFTPNTDYMAKVKADLKKNGISDTEELFDPKTGKSIGPVMTGDQYFLKLHHIVEHKMAARSHGGAYTSKGMAPSGSGIPGGGQRIDQLTIYSMLAHGANANLRESATYKSDQDQDEVWTAVQTGQPLPDPKPTRSMGLFQDYLKAMGVHVEKKGDNYVLAPLTDKQTKKMSNGTIKFPNKALLAKGLRTLEEAGGLFDTKVTGGLDGKYWGHINLQRRIPNPVFEKAILSLTDMKRAEFEDLVGSKLTVKGKSGFDVINEKLNAIDVDKEIAELKAAIPKIRADRLAKALKKLRYLQNLKKLGISPLDAYTNKSLPVVPPTARRVSIGLDGTQIFDDLNGLYLSVGQINQQLKNVDPSTPRSEIQKQEAHLYDAVRALRISGMDMGERAKARHHFGLMEKLKGTAPKTSFFQDSVIKRRQDLSGRSTIVPEPKMGLDEVGIPLPMAMEMYKPFVVRELRTSQGLTPLRAQKLIKSKDKMAIEALHRVVANRPVMMKRDPSLHKFSIMAFNPRVVEGKAIKIHPLVTGGFNADFDGDTMALYVPVSDEAVDEARQKMLPSKNLFSPTHGRLMPVPGQDSVIGIYKMTEWGSPAKNLPANTSPQRIIDLLEKGKLSASDVVSYNGKKTTAGRLALDKALPLPMRDDQKLLYDKTFRLDGRKMEEFLTVVAKKHPTEFPTVVDKWKDYGNKFAYLQGTSFSLNDFHDGAKFRDSILKKYKVEENKIWKSRLPGKEKDQKVVDLYAKATEELKTRGTLRYDKTDNKVYDWVKAKAKGNWAQFAQMVFAAGIVLDAKKNPVPVPITKSFGEGLPVSQYWASLHGARKGTIDRARGTAEPGAVSKDIINTVINYQVTSDDCGTTKGISVDPNDATADVSDRYLAKSVKLKSGEEIAAKTLLTPQALMRIRNSGVKKIIVRSPLHCRQPQGICAVCYGLNEQGKKFQNGTNVGVIAGQALGEPMTQMAMKTFHTGGVASAGGSAIDNFQRAKDIFKVPKTLKDSAKLSDVTGSVQFLTKNVAMGGWDVTIAGQLHRVTGRQQLLDHIKVGAPIKKGDPLTEGPINPHQMLQQTKNISAVRGYMTEELKKVYPDGIRRRNIETVVKALTNLARVNHDPSNEFIRGESVRMSELEHRNLMAGQDSGSFINFTPLLRPMTEIPLEAQEDWMAKLNYTKLQQTYTEGAAQGWSSDIHGHPIPGLAHGVEFGTKLPRGVEPPGMMETVSPLKIPKVVQTPSLVLPDVTPTGFKSLFRSTPSWKKK